MSYAFTIENGVLFVFFLISLVCLCIIFFHYYVFISAFTKEILAGVAGGIVLIVGIVGFLAYR